MKGLVNALLFGDGDTEKEGVTVIKRLVLTLPPPENKCLAARAKQDDRPIEQEAVHLLRRLLREETIAPTHFVIRPACSLVHFRHLDPAQRGAVVWFAVRLPAHVRLRHLSRSWLVASVVLAALVALAASTAAGASPAD